MYATQQFAECPTCGDQRPVEMPLCTDGHGVDCPDRTCTDCGTAILLDPILPTVDRDDIPRAA